MADPTCCWYSRGSCGLWRGPLKLTDIFHSTKLRTGEMTLLYYFDLIFYFLLKVIGVAVCSVKPSFFIKAIIGSSSLFPLDFVSAGLIGSSSVVSGYMSCCMFSFSLCSDLNSNYTCTNEICSFVSFKSLFVFLHPVLGQEKSGDDLHQGQSHQ